MKFECQHREYGPIKVKIYYGQIARLCDVRGADISYGPGVIVKGTYTGRPSFSLTRTAPCTEDDLRTGEPLPVSDEIIEDLVDQVVAEVRSRCTWFGLGLSPEELTSRNDAGAPVENPPD